MSVLVCDRDKSKYEPITSAADLRMQIRELMERNFGIKKRAFICLMKYDAGGTYKIFLKTHKLQLDMLTAQVASYTRAANGMYPRTMKEYELRRAYQTDAISHCEKIIEELQAIVVYFKTLEDKIPGFRIDINGCKPSIDAIDREIELIKNWRQGDNRFRKVFRQG